MRWILPLFLFIAGLGFLAAELPCCESYRAGENQQVVEHSNDWRRTARGWQHSSDWAPPLKIDPPALHPAVVGSFQLLLVLAVSLAFDTSGARNKK